MSGGRTEATPTAPHILHVDMDAFYASVEIRDDPSLRGKPVIVGGSGDRGVVAAASYEARVRGVHSAMPSARARRLCPDAVWLRGRFDRYIEVSGRLHELFAEITPVVEGIALDEAFLDVSGAGRLLGSPLEIAWRLRGRIQDELALTASVGVAAVKMLAKLASEAAKPKVTRSGPVPGPGVVVIEPGTEVQFLHPLPIRALWGVGPATAQRLGRFGVQTVGDLAALPVETLVGSLGAGLGRHLHELAWARDARPVVADAPTKSISHEETYGHDLVDPGDLRREVVRQSDAVANRLRRAGLAGRTVTIKVRSPDFATVTRSRTLPTPTENGAEIARVAGELLEAVDTTTGVRLLGVGVSQLGPPPDRQLSFDDLGGTADGAGSGDWDRASDAVDAIRRRFGDAAVGPTALVAGGRVRVKGLGDTQWGPHGDDEGEAPAAR